MRVPVRCCGHELVCLIDCGASRCYLDSQMCLRLGLQPVTENATLELGDGTRVPAKGCIEKLIFSMGSRTFSQNFTVTELMTGVDIVLGMTWLEQVNPLSTGVPIRCTFKTRTLITPSQVFQWTRTPKSAQLSISRYPRTKKTTSLYSMSIHWK